MGIYVYKVTARTVALENGATANVALFAYKLGSRSRGRDHQLSGAASHDRAAEEGKRGRWVVHGFLDDDGTLGVSPTAVQLPEPIGSYIEELDPKGILPRANVDQTRLPRRAVINA